MEQIVDIINDQIRSNLFIKSKILESNNLQNYIVNVYQLILDCLKYGNKLMICGNGGSAADSQHFAAELVGRFMKNRKAYDAIALTTDTSIITAVGNDYSFDEIFSRQIEGIGKKGDVLFVLSTSGNSINIKKALEKGKSLGIHLVGLFGKGGGYCAPMCDYSYVVESSESARIQETHIMIEHIICQLLEEGMIRDE